MKKWLNYKFVGGSYVEEDFKKFTRNFKSYLKKTVEDTGIELAKYSVGHYYVSGFFKKGEKFIYFSISDVRYEQDGWYKDILYRTAEDLKDYRGGSNHFTTLPDLLKSLERLFDR